MTWAERQEGEAMQLLASVGEDADLRGIVDTAREQYSDLAERACRTALSIKEKVEIYQLKGMA